MEPRKVSGGASKLTSSTSTTSPISSTSRLTAPSSERTTTFMASMSAGRGSNSSLRRKSTAVTIWPRRLIRPLTTAGASGTFVISSERITS